MDTFTYSFINVSSLALFAPFFMEHLENNLGVKYSVSAHRATSFEFLRWLQLFHSQQVICVCSEQSELETP